jgi:hypothetical protein
VQGRPGDPNTDKDWADLQGKDRWNFLISSRSNHLIEFEGIFVKLGYERTNTSTLQNGATREVISTKKSLQEVVTWLIEEYSKDASAMYVRWGLPKSFSPIPLKELLVITHKVDSVKIRSAFYPPDQVKFDYRCNLWIKHNCKRAIVIRATQRRSPNKTVLHGLGVCLNYWPQVITLQHQQLVPQWLIKAYTKDSCCFYCDRVEHSTGYHFRGIFNNIQDLEEITISKEAKQATLNKIYQRQQGFGQLYIPGVEHLTNSPEHEYLAAVKLQHTMSWILVEGTTPLSFDKEEWEYNKDNNNGKNNDLDDNGNNKGTMERPTTTTKTTTTTTATIMATTTTILTGNLT